MELGRRLLRIRQAGIDSRIAGGLAAQVNVEYGVEVRVQIESAGTRAHT
jgi:hypothetical protein